MDVSAKLLCRFTLPLPSWEDGHRRLDHRVAEGAPIPRRAATAVGAHIVDTHAIDAGVVEAVVGVDLACLAGCTAGAATNEVPVGRDDTRLGVRARVARTRIDPATDRAVRRPEAGQHEHQVIHVNFVVAIIARLHVVAVRVNVAEVIPVSRAEPGQQLQHLAEGKQRGEARESVSVCLRGIVCGGGLYTTDMAGLRP